MQRFYLTTAFSSLALAGLAPAALAQSVHSNYLNDLYSFLQQQDAVAYNAATEYAGDEKNIYLAQSLCQAYQEGVAPDDVFSLMTTAAMSEASQQGFNFNDDEAYSLGLYVGAVMNLGAAYYCPDYQPQVEAALRAL